MKTLVLIILLILNFTHLANADELAKSVAEQVMSVEVNVPIPQLRKNLESSQKNNLSKFAGCTIPAGLLVLGDDLYRSFLSKQLELEAGDVLIQFDGKKLGSKADISTVLEGLEKNKSGKLLVHRQCKTLELAYTYNRKNIVLFPAFGEKSNKKTKIDMSQIASSAKVAPNFKDGKQNGLRLVGIKANSIYANMGFKNNDAIIAVNDKQINDRGLWYSFFSQIGEKENVTFSVERGGQPKKMNFSKSEIGKVVEDTLKSGGDLYYKIERQALEAETKNIPRLMSQARAHPFFRKGKAIGQRYFTIIDNSIFQKLGLQNGDILLDIDGGEIPTSDQALRLPEVIYANNKSILSIERDGALFKINIEIK